MLLPERPLVLLLEKVPDVPKVRELPPAGLGGARARDAVALAHLPHRLPMKEEGFGQSTMFLQCFFSSKHFWLVCTSLIKIIWL